MLVPHVPVGETLSANWVNGRYHAPDEELLYRTYFENSVEGLFIIDVGLDGRFIFRELNPIYEQLTGLSTGFLRDARRMTACRKTLRTASTQTIAGAWRPGPQSSMRRSWSFRAENETGKRL